MTGRAGTSRPGVRRVAVGILAALLAAALLAAGTVVQRAYLAPPENTPAEFRSRGPAPGSGPVVVVAGASLVHASLSADWVGMVRERSGLGPRLVNAGVNGDTTAGLLARVADDVIAPDPDVVAVLVGTNDVRDGVPLEQSRANITALVDRVTAEAEPARMALLSLPPLGEDLDSARNRAAGEYNAMLAAVAAERGVDYLPTGERVADLVRANGGGPAYAFGPLLSFRIAVEHHLLGRRFDDIAPDDGLHVLTDHIHLGERGATAVAEVVHDWL